MFNPDSFKNEECDGKTVGFSFETKIQYYRGITLSIIRDLKVEIDGKAFPRDSIRFAVNGECFSLEEMRTVLSNRWHFQQWGKVIVLADGGLSKGKHHIKFTQVIAPSYMPQILTGTGERDFTI
jgi:hypothetical protein